MISRRDVLKCLTVLVAGYGLPASNAWAQSRSAVLVAKSELVEEVDGRNQLRGGLDRLRELSVCVAGPGSTSDILARQIGIGGDKIRIMGSLARRVGALRDGTCDAILLASSTRTQDELKEDIGLFSPELNEYELVDLPNI